MSKEATIVDVQKCQNTLLAHARNLFRSRPRETVENYARTAGVENFIVE